MRMLAGNKHRDTENIVAGDSW